MKVQLLRCVCACSHGFVGSPLTACPSCGSYQTQGEPVMLRPLVYMPPPDDDGDSIVAAVHLCLKQVVMAVVTSVDGEEFAATNHRENPVPACPRAGMRTGEGYELCRDVCRQPGHAEINALLLAGEKARGGTMRIEGHTYACENCFAACRAAGIVSVEVGGKTSAP